MTPLNSDRTRTLKETVAELTPAEAVQKFKPFFGLTPHSRLKFFQKSCDELVSYGIDDLWYFYGGRQNASDFGALLEVRDRLLKEVSKPKIQYIREEFERIGVQRREIDFDDLDDPRPYFDVASSFGEITVQGNLYNEIALGKGKKRYQPFFLSTNFEDLRKLLLALPTSIGESAFWESVKVYKLVNQIAGEQQKIHDEFEHEERRRKSRKESPRVRIVGGKYAGLFGYLIFTKRKPGPRRGRTLARKMDQNSNPRKKHRTNEGMKTYFSDPISRPRDFSARKVFSELESQLQN